MHLHFDNVNDAFPVICRAFKFQKLIIATDISVGEDEKVVITPRIPFLCEETRYGRAIRIAEPMTITYANPLKRLLFHPVRDCNPFFHLVESLWMLSGQRAVAPLLHFNKRMETFVDSDTNGNMWGAYGYRWREWFGWDQLALVIQILKSDPGTRRVVLQMWDVKDLDRVVNKPTCKDVPCNTEIMFLARKEEAGWVLDMTVLNRSNDTIWGALGANYVHFSFLLEYVANSVGMAVGRYHQISNNLHIYETDGKWHGMNPDDLAWDLNPVNMDNYQHYPLFESGQQLLFRHDCDSLFTFPHFLTEPTGITLFRTSFFNVTVQPMLLAWSCYKEKNIQKALMYASRIVPQDWRFACTQWLHRRTERKNPTTH